MPIALATLIISITSRVDSIPPNPADLGFERMRLNKTHNPTGRRAPRAALKPGEWGGRQAEKRFLLAQYSCPWAKKRNQSLDVALVEEDSPIPLDHPASPVGVGEFPVDAPRGNSTLSPGPVMYDMPMLDSTAPSVDYACYDACRADHRGSTPQKSQGLRAERRMLATKPKG